MVVWNIPTEQQNFVTGFFHAINWTETFILALIGFHIFIYCLVYISRYKSWLRHTLLICISVLIALSERFNKLGALHWKKFCTQNYFDTNGVFTSLTFSTPLLIAGFVLLILLLIEVSGLLIKVKRKEIKLYLQQKNAKND